MYWSMAAGNGMLLALMIFFNGMVSAAIGAIPGTVIFHGVGLLVVLLIAMARNSRLPKLRELNVWSLLPGIVSVVTILLNNVCIPQLGVMLTMGISLYGQLIASILISHYGLLGMPISRLSTDKVPGFLIVSAGILLMTL